MGLEPVWITSGCLFVVQTPNGELFVNNATSSLNSHLSASLTRNKYLTRVILGRHGLPNIPFARPRTIIEARLFLENYRKVIVKPLTGSGSRDIRVIESPLQLTGLPLPGNIFEQYIPGIEMRYLVLNGAVVGVHESKYGASVEATRYLERIAYEQAQWDPACSAMSLQIADVMGLRFAAIDFMIDENGKPYVLEVNSSPGLKWFHAPTAGPPLDIATMFMEAAMQQ